jgi:hypothetical protein
MTSKTTDTAPNNESGVYTETESNNMSASAGEGNYQGTPLVITGSITASGKATLTLE